MTFEPHCWFASSWTLFHPSFERPFLQSVVAVDPIMVKSSCCYNYFRRCMMTFEWWKCSCRSTIVCVVLFVVAIVLVVAMSFQHQLYFHFWIPHVCRLIFSGKFVITIRNDAILHIFISETHRLICLVGLLRYDGVFTFGLFFVQDEKTLVVKWRTQKSISCVKESFWKTS